MKICIFATGKSYTTSSQLTPPGSEESKGMMVERCDIRGLPIFFENIEYRMSDIELRNEKSENEIQNAKCKMQNTNFDIQYSLFEIRNSIRYLTFDFTFNLCC